MVLGPKRKTWLKMADEEKQAETTTKRRPSKAESKCSVEGCKRPFRAKSYCNVHYKAWRHGEIEGHKSRYKTCSKEACKKPVSMWGLCDEHYKAKKGGGEEAAPATA
jgi:hypothetical protein